MFDLSSFPRHSPWLRRLFAGLVGLFALVLQVQPVVAESQSDFLFTLRTALKAGDRESLRQCFEFKGADEATLRAIDNAIEQMLAWPTHFVKTTDRINSGPMEMERDGRRFTLNGDWTFQVHIHIRKPPSRGFVLPGGVTADGRNAILLSVPVEG